MKLQPITENPEYRGEAERLAALQARRDETARRAAECEALLAKAREDSRPAEAVGALLADPDADLGGVVAARSAVLRDELEALRAEGRTLRAACDEQRKRLDGLRARLSGELARKLEGEHRERLRAVAEAVANCGEALAAERQLRLEMNAAGFDGDLMPGPSYSLRGEVLFARLGERGVLTAAEVAALRARIGAEDRAPERPRPSAMRFVETVLPIRHPRLGAAL